MSDRYKAVVIEEILASLARVDQACVAGLTVSYSIA
jgi:hypothetical protein